MALFSVKLENYLYNDKKYLCFFVLVCVTFLTLIGLVVLASASLSFCKNESYFSKQLYWALISVPFFLFGLFLDLEFLRKFSGKLLIFSFILLCCVLVPGVGRSVNGSRRWLACGGINLQISEFVKFVVIMWLADYIDNNNESIKTFITGFIVPLATIAMVSLVILLEPDYGTAILIGGVTFTLLFLFGSRIFYILGALVVAFFTISVLIFFNPVRMRRIIAFLDVDSNKLGGAYQLWQGILGFASGGLFGKGLGNGRQQLVYLPESHTDFILPIVGEEFGSIVVVGLLLLYLCLFIACMIASSRIKSIYLSVISSGIVLIIAYQVIINVGVVTGLLPTKGMVLPFISYGGSNLLVMFFMIGVLINCFVTDSFASNVDK
ncbi:MAG: putative lipid II flippase FtsW [Opitutales bacterium]|nr:putative lipid II flippase FtsW [Opitutales bacterium]